jgi:murein DD-endopeptidase MepM/ murein hydrolase activator NlpD
MSSIFLLMLLLALGAACSGTSGAARTATPDATSTPVAPDLSVFTNFIYPIKGACLPSGDQLMPNADRAYRGGVHEGVDFYGYDACTSIIKGTAVLAAKDGTVIRADHDYHALTPAELTAADERIAEGHANDFDVIDLFRGRQVWIDHGKGIVTRYAHLSDIAANVQVGTQVVQGETIGFVGDSGTPESISSPGTEEHLHFELRAGEDFLGRGLPPDQERAIYERLFQPGSAPAAAR